MMNITRDHLTKESMRELLTRGCVITKYQYMKSLIRFDASVRKSEVITHEGLDYHYGPHVDAQVLVVETYLQYVLVELPHKVKMWDDPHAWHLVWDTWTLTVQEFFDLIRSTRPNAS